MDKNALNARTYGGRFVKKSLRDVAKTSCVLNTRRKDTCYLFITKANKDFPKVGKRDNYKESNYTL